MKIIKVDKQTHDAIKTKAHYEGMTMHRYVKKIVLADNDYITRDCINCDNIMEVSSVNNVHKIYLCLNCGTFCRESSKDKKVSWLFPKSDKIEVVQE